MTVVTTVKHTFHRSFRSIPSSVMVNVLPVMFGLITYTMLTSFFEYSLTVMGVSILHIRYKSLHYS